MEDCAYQKQGLRIKIVVTGDITNNCQENQEVFFYIWENTQTLITPHT